MMSNYVIAVYVSSDPGMYMVHIRFTFQNRVWQAVGAAGPWPHMSAPENSSWATQCELGNGPKVRIQAHRGVFLFFLLFFLFISKFKDSN
jgi:hypothetical protein